MFSTVPGFDNPKAALRSENEIKRGAAVAICWTVLADSGAVMTGMVGRHLFVSPGQGLEQVLGPGGESVLPALVDAMLPALLAGVMIAVVLSAIMSTVDSLLVVASSAFVRDYYQKTRHPDLADSALVSMSRRTTAVLAVLALGLALTVSVLSPNRTIFWFVIFGWSGIAATFCPVMILALSWQRYNVWGALASMLTGALGVPAHADQSGPACRGQRC